MKKIVSALVAMMLLLCSIAMAEDAATPSTSTDDFTKPEITNPDSDNKEDDFYLDIITDDTPADPDADQSAQEEILDKRDEQVEDLTEKMHEYETAEDPNAYIYEFFYTASDLINEDNRDDENAKAAAREDLKKTFEKEFGIGIKLMVHEFHALQAVNYNEATVPDTVRMAIKFAANYTDKVSVMIGTFDSEGFLTWEMHICEVDDEGRVILTLSKETAALIDAGMALMAVISAE